MSFNFAQKGYKCTRFYASGSSPYRSQRGNCHTIVSDYKRLYDSAELIDDSPICSLDKIYVNCCY